MQYEHANTTLQRPFDALTWSMARDTDHRMRMHVHGTWKGISAFGHVLVWVFARVCSGALVAKRENNIDGSSLYEDPIKNLCCNSLHVYRNTVRVESAVSTSEGGHTPDFHVDIAAAQPKERIRYLIICISFHNHSKLLYY